MSAQTENSSVVDTESALLDVKLSSRALMLLTYGLMNSPDALQDRDAEAVYWLARHVGRQVEGLDAAFHEKSLDIQQVRR